MTTDKNWMMIGDQCFPLTELKPIEPSQEVRWIHLTPQNENELVCFLEKLKIHPLTIEDMLNSNSRIKLEHFST
jgi:Mg2+ and Co2+ transporter CorA